RPHPAALTLSGPLNPWQDKPELLAERWTLFDRDQGSFRSVRDAAAGVALQHHLRRGDDAARLRTAAGCAFRPGAELGRPLSRVRRPAHRHGHEFYHRRRVLV